MLEINATPQLGATLILLLMLCIWWLIVEWGFNKPKTSNQNKQPAKTTDHQQPASGINPHRNKDSQIRESQIREHHNREKRQSNNLASSGRELQATHRKTRFSGESTPGKYKPDQSSTTKSAPSAPQTETSQIAATLYNEQNNVNTQANPHGAIDSEQTGKSLSHSYNKPAAPIDQTSNPDKLIGQSVRADATAGPNQSQDSEATESNNSNFSVDLTRPVTQNMRPDSSVKLQGENSDNSGQIKPRLPTETNVSELNVQPEQHHVQAEQSSRQVKPKTSAHTNNSNNRSTGDISTGKANNPEKSKGMPESRHTTALVNKKPTKGSQQGNHTLKKQNTALPNEAEVSGNNSTAKSIELKTPVVNSATETVTPKKKQKAPGVAKYQTAAKAKSPSARSEASIQIQTVATQRANQKANQKTNTETRDTANRSTNEPLETSNIHSDPQAEKNAVQFQVHSTSTRKNPADADTTATQITRQNSEPTTPSSSTVRSISVAATTRAKSQSNNSDLAKASKNTISSTNFKSNIGARKQSSIEMAVAQKTSAIETQSSTARTTTEAPNASSAEKTVPVTKTVEDSCERKTTSDLATEGLLPDTHNLASVSADSHGRDPRHRHGDGHGEKQTSEATVVDADATLRAQLACSERRIESLQSTLNNLQDSLPNMTAAVSATKAKQQPHNRPTLLSKVRILDHPKA